MEHQVIQSITENLWWVIPDKLAGVRKPTAEELAELQTAGVGAIVSVMDDPTNLDLYQQSNIPYLWLPTKGGTAPTLEQVHRLREFVDQYNQSRIAIAIHCTNGKRRTATMLVAYLISSGFSYDDAIQIIQTTNPDVELREAQTLFLQNLARNS